MSSNLFCFRFLNIQEHCEDVSGDRSTLEQTLHKIHIFQNSITSSVGSEAKVAIGITRTLELAAIC